MHGHLNIKINCMVVCGLDQASLHEDIFLLNVSTIWRGVAILILRPPYPRYLWMRGWVDSRASLNTSRQTNLYRESNLVPVFQPMPWASLSGLYKLTMSHKYITLDRVIGSSVNTNLSVSSFVLWTNHPWLRRNRRPLFYRLQFRAVISIKKRWRH
jgi:hypothetical protein